MSRSETLRAIINEAYGHDGTILNDSEKALYIEILEDYFDGCTYDATNRIKELMDRVNERRECENA